jgi:hypothetical protein
MWKRAGHRKLDLQLRMPNEEATGRSTRIIGQPPKAADDPGGLPWVSVPPNHDHVTNPVAGEYDSRLWSNPLRLALLFVELPQQSEASSQPSILCGKSWLGVRQRLSSYGCQQSSAAATRDNQIEAFR